jgi:hypothetical protein
MESCYGFFDKLLKDQETRKSFGIFIRNRLVGFLELININSNANTAELEFLLAENMQG